MHGVHLRARRAAALNTITVTDTWFPQLRDVAPADVQPQLDIYTEAMTAGGFEEELNGFAVTSFAAILELSEIMKAIGAEVTPEALIGGLENASDIPGFMRPNGSCRTEIWPSEPATCRASLLFLEVVRRGRSAHPNASLLATTSSTSRASPSDLALTLTMPSPGGAGDA